MVNLPLAADTMALRIVGEYGYTSGWIDRLVVPNFPLATNGGLTRGNVLAAPVTAAHRGANDERLTGARVSLLIKPSEGRTPTTATWERRRTMNPSTSPSPSKSGIADGFCRAVVNRGDVPPRIDGRSVDRQGLRRGDASRVRAVSAVRGGDRVGAVSQTTRIEMRDPGRIERAGAERAASVMEGHSAG